MIVLHVLLRILIIIGAILGAVLVILIAAMWSSVKFEFAANGSNAVLTVSLWHVLRYTFYMPGKRSAETGPEEAQRNVKSAEKIKNDDASNEHTDKKRSGIKERLKDLIGDEDESTFKEDLKGLWNSEYNTFDFEALHVMIIKYAEKFSDYKYGLGRFFGLMRYKIRIDRIDVYIRYGSGEPDKTGMAYGAMYAGAGSIASLLRRFFKIKEAPRLFLAPDYVNRTFEFEVGCTVKTRAAHVVNSLAIAFISYIIRKKRRNAQSSIADNAEGVTNV